MSTNEQRIPEIKYAPELSSDELLSVFDNVFDVFGVLDPQGRVVELHGRIFERTQTDPQLLTGQVFAETVFWQSTEYTSALLANAISNAASGESIKLSVDFRVSVNERIPLELTLQPIRENAAVFLAARRIRRSEVQADAKGLEANQLLAAAENAEIGLWYWDFTEDRIHSTPRCNELLGLPPYEPLNRESFYRVVHRDDREFVASFLELSRNEGSKYEEQFRVKYPDGSVEWISAEGKTFLESSGRPPRMVGIVRKITEQKIADEELSKVHERERKARFEAMEANRAKDFFLAFVSHELRAPLNAILGWSKILLTKEVDEETRRNALETIERSARVQTKLINDLVDSARVASGKLRMEYRPTNLFDLVHGSFQAHKPAADSKGIKLEFGADRSDVIIFGDVNRLQQVFGNLISNAIKFTAKGGIVSVDITTGESSAAICITDTGQGISQDSLPRIFRQFSQGETDEARNSAGLGLGLSIAKILVERHGGQIRAESEGIGRGACFTVTLPLTESATELAEKAVTAASTERRSLEGISILIVEDDSDSREVLQLFLEQNGAVVFSTADARTAMSVLTEMKGKLPRLIISDLAMPDEDGYSLLAHIRGLPTEEGGRIPAMALSAFATAESREKAFLSGFQKYSTKPFEPDLIVRDILELVGSNGRPEG